ncbi:hypothetical protein EW146_g9844 [Bondarzewia mesenterica]|uniref:Pentacotripeptide-repeat region of PRORP domain-containing protein n=1 Tax=Bondarzewia mesenterica TaxID=1095465 RepID=A0A4S4L2R6_9AGAM|nr:hypothetical protein EW146_g9844 [Bondarzewia mesenterica]
MFFWRSLQRFPYVSRPPQKLYFKNDHGRLSRVHKQLISSFPSSSSTSVFELAIQFRNRVWDSISSSKRHPLVHEAYDCLRNVIKRSKGLHAVTKDRNPLQTADFFDALEVLASSGMPEDIALMHVILEDMPSLFGEPVTSEIQLAIIRKLVHHGDAQTVYHWLDTMDQKPGAGGLTSEHWHQLLKLCSKRGDVDMMWRAVERMTKSPCPPTNATFKLLLHGVFQSPARHFSQALRVIDNLRILRLPPDPSLLSLMMEGLTQKGLLVKASKPDPITFPENLG